MTNYVPQKGDRVRVTIEGVVGYVSGRSFDFDHSDGNALYSVKYDEPGVKVKKIEPPVPTLHEQFLALKPGDIFTITAAHFGSERRIKLDDASYYNTRQRSVIRATGAASDVTLPGNQRLSLQVVEK